MGRRGRAYRIIHKQWAHFVLHLFGAAGCEVVHILRLVFMFRLSFRGVSMGGQNARAPSILGRTWVVGVSQDEGLSTLGRGQHGWPECEDSDHSGDGQGGWDFRRMRV